MSQPVEHDPSRLSDAQLILSLKATTRQLERALAEKRSDGYEANLELSTALQNLLSMFQMRQINAHPHMVAHCVVVML